MSRRDGDRPDGDRRDADRSEPTPVLPEDVDPKSLDATTDALRAALSPPELDTLDHESLIAMTLGDDVSEIGDGEPERAERLRLALEGEGSDPLADFARALRATHIGAGDRGLLAGADHEALLALTLGDETSRFDEAEREQAERLRLGLLRSSDEPLVSFCRTLQATHAAETGPALAAIDNEVLVALTVGDEQFVASDDERQQAAALASAMDGEGSHPLAELSRAIRACAGKLADIDELGHARLLKRVFGKRDPRHVDETGRRGGATVVAAIVALAASVALFVGSWRWFETKAGPTANNQPVQLELVVSRSTSELFDPMAPFPAKGGESERMNRIVRARQADLRKNRFASWGVR